MPWPHSAAVGKALDEGALDGAQPIGATEFTLGISEKAIECLGRASAAVELAARKQAAADCLVRAATSLVSLGFRVGHHLLAVDVMPTTSRQSRRRPSPSGAVTGLSHRKAETIPRGG